MQMYILQFWRQKPNMGLVELKSRWGQGRMIFLEALEENSPPCFLHILEAATPTGYSPSHLQSLQQSVESLSLESLWLCFWGHISFSDSDTPAPSVKDPCG